MQLSRFAVGLLLTAGAVFAQPRIDLVQNNYSYLLPDNANYGIAQGSIVLIKGSNLATFSTPLQSVPLKTNINGVSAQVTVNGFSKDLILYYVTPNAIGAIIPSSTPAGQGTLVVSNGQAGASIPVTIVQAAFGALTQDGSGTGRALATDANFNPLTNERPAKPGDTIVLFGTGLGPVTGDETVEQKQTNLSHPFASAMVGGQQATVAYAGRTIYPGLDQVNLTIPNGSLPAQPALQGNQLGCNVAVVFVSSLTALRANTVTIPVSADGSACIDPTIPSGGTIDPTISQLEVDQWLGAGQYRSGSLALSRSTNYYHNPSGLAAGASDNLTAGFLKISGSDLAKSLNNTAKPGSPQVPGTCSVTLSPANQSPAATPALNFQSLNSGTAVGVNGPNGLRMAPPRTGFQIIGDTSVPSIQYSADIGSTAPRDYLDPGHYTFFSPGGPDVGAFSGGVDFAGFDLKWINREALESITRADGLTLAWTGGGGDPTAIAVISGSSSLPPPANPTEGIQSLGSSSFTCYANVGDGHFAVPASIASQLYATQTVGSSNLPSYGQLSIGVAKRVRLQAVGIDYLTAGVSDSISQSTEWK